MILYNYLKKYKWNIIISFFILIGSFFISKFENKRLIRMLDHPKFSIGIITSEFHSKTTLKSPGNDFVYYINRIEFKGVTSAGSNCKLKDVGDRFLIIFDSIKVGKSSRLLCNYPIPDSIKAPPDGWRLDEVPIEIDMKRIEAYIK